MSPVRAGTFTGTTAAVGGTGAEVEVTAAEVGVAVCAPPSEAQPARATSVARAAAQADARERSIGNRLMRRSCRGLRDHRCMRPDEPALGPTSITVACVNFEAVPRDKAATLEKMATFVADAAGHGSDLVIFPELALNTWGACA